ncbi:unnamed protein product [marine sediment metagenome]|uniref:Uncharacterized protein n=1 Tax=marine sediment metagenome TaxID=412755 RepID=X0ZYG3_9ZZZZ
MKTRIYLVVEHPFGVTESDITKLIKLPYNWYIENSEWIK